MIYEFQIEGEQGDWASLGLARTTGGEPAIEEAALALRGNCGGHLPAGSYRVRILELKPRWRYAEVDADGIFRLTDRPPAHG